MGFGKLGQFIADKIMNDEVVSEKLELSWVWNRSASAFDGDAGVRRVTSAALHIAGPNHARMANKTVALTPDDWNRVGVSLQAMGFLKELFSKTLTILTSVMLISSSRSLPGPVCAARPFVVCSLTALGGQVAHPNISRDYAEKFLEHADYLVCDAHCHCSVMVLSRSLLTASAIADGLPDSHGRPGHQRHGSFTLPSWNACPQSQRVTNVLVHSLRVIGAGGSGRPERPWRLCASRCTVGR